MKRFTRKRKWHTMIAGTKKHKSKKASCSPQALMMNQSSISAFSCYDKEQLVQLRDMWNKRHADKQITSNDPQTIHTTLSEHLSNVCSNEQCWLRQRFAFPAQKELLKNFAPKPPSSWQQNPNEWLSSDDLNAVMKQYEEAYPCFVFLGPSPIDFDTKLHNGECVWDELCHFSIEHWLQKRKHKIGIIFNTDPHNKSGQHWISMFVHLKKHWIFYFDSTGEPAPREIKQLVKRIQDEGKRLGHTYRYEDTEGVKHQQGNTECGIYALYFIVHMLQDKLQGAALKSKRLTDEYIQSFRSIYFNQAGGTSTTR